MATSFEHRALVEQLRALTSKRAENPGEKILNTSHPSGSNSAADDHTRPAVVGHRYQENSADNKKMYPFGTDSDIKNESGTEQKDPGNNKGLHPRPSGEAPEVEKDYNLNDHNDPGTSHPSGKAAQEFIAEARGLATEIRELIKKATGSEYVSGQCSDTAKNTKKDNASGTASYPANDENDENIEIPEDSGKNAEERHKIAVLRAQATHEMRQLKDHMKTAADIDAASFVAAVTGVMDKFALPHVAPVVEQIKKAQVAEVQAIKQAEVADAMEKIAIYDAIAEVDGAPKFSKVIGAVDSALKAKLSRNGDEDDDAGETYDEGEEEEGEKAAKRAALKNSKKTPSKKEASSSKGRNSCKIAEEEEETIEEGDCPAEEGVSKKEELAAEEALADMAAAPAESPDVGGDPSVMEGDSGLSPEEEAALMALIQQEGLKESDVKAYAKIASSIAVGKIHPAKLSDAQKAFISTCDGAIKRAGAKFQTLRSASRLRNELNSIYKGIQ